MIDVEMLLHIEMKLYSGLSGSCTSEVSLCQLKTGEMTLQQIFIHDLLNCYLVKTCWLKGVGMYLKKYSDNMSTCECYRCLTVPVEWPFLQHCNCHCTGSRTTLSVALHSHLKKYRKLQLWYCAVGKMNKQKKTPYLYQKTEQW